MKFIADFHIHSHYSVATSKNLIPEYLEYWARVKGINVIGTGDCIHPGWLSELKEKFDLCDNGLYSLKDEYRLDESRQLRVPNIPEKIYFMLTGELSSIYKKDGKVRKVHNVLVFPDFAAAEKVQRQLDEIGNIRSDGRPILGVDSKIILGMTLESAPTSFLIPAHIWTPWFSVLGSKSGFDSLDECYEDLTQHIFAVETGLSSDPAMNWSCSILDKFRLVSNSDAHSPEKLGREANIFDTELSYLSIYEALKESDNTGFKGTIEFYPEEGKYHYDGHRKCNVRWDPLETVRNNGICTECGKPVTLGVLYRVAELADRTDITRAPFYGEYHSITQLPDLLAEYLGKKNFKSKAVMNMYYSMLSKVGSEFYTLLFASRDELIHGSDEIVASGIERLRNGHILIDEGYDGEFGTIRVFTKDETNTSTSNSLFSNDTAITNETIPQTPYNSMAFNVEEFKQLKQNNTPVNSGKNDLAGKEKTDTVPKGNDRQTDAINHSNGPCMVLAGPGSGKTYVLTQRIAHLVKDQAIDPVSILALTFSNRAAEEMRTRISGLLGNTEISVSTFHAFGLSLLKEHFALTGRSRDFYIIDEDEKREIISKTCSDIRQHKKLAGYIEHKKQGIDSEVESDELNTFFDAYNRELCELNAYDISDLVYIVIKVIADNSGLARSLRARYKYILVDEFQDINAVQYRLLTLLAPDKDADLFVIGDPDQAIYGFRGSDVKFIEQLKTDYPDITIVQLSRSYRCPDYIIKAASQLLQKEHILLGTKQTLKINILSMETDRSEADWIAASIEKQMGGVRSFSMDSGITDGESESVDCSFSDFAILCRSSFMFSALEEALSNHGIAYQVIGTDPFYTEQPFAGAINALKHIFYRNRDNIFSRDIDEDIRDMLKKGDSIADILKFLLVIEEATNQHIETMVHFAEYYKNDYNTFFRTLATRHGSDEYKKQAEFVTIMTLHASKGLEFPTVFIPGCEEGIIPFELFGKKTVTELAEEERLLYVGVTRTQKQLFLSQAASRNYKGRILRSERSHFIDRLEKELLKETKRKSAKKKKTDDGQLNLF